MHWPQTKLTKFNHWRNSCPSSCCSMTEKRFWFSQFSLTINTATTDLHLLEELLRQLEKDSATVFADHKHSHNWHSSTWGTPVSVTKGFCNSIHWPQSHNWPSSTTWILQQYSLTTNTVTTDIQVLRDSATVFADHKHSHNWHSSTSGILQQYSLITNTTDLQVLQGFCNNIRWPQTQSQLTFKYFRDSATVFTDHKHSHNWHLSTSGILQQYSLTTNTTDLQVLEELLSLSQNDSATVFTDHKHSHNWPSSTWGTPVSVPAAPWQRRKRGGWWCPLSAAASPCSACPPSGPHWCEAEFEWTLKTSMQYQRAGGQNAQRHQCMRCSSDLSDCVKILWSRIHGYAQRHQCMRCSSDLSDCVKILWSRIHGYAQK